MLSWYFLEKIQIKYAKEMHKQLVLKVSILLQSTGKVLHFYKD